MKKATSLVLLVIVIVGGFIGCKKIIKAIFPGLDVDIPAITVTIPALQPFPGAPVPQGEVPVGSFSQHFNLDSIVKDRTSGTFGASDVSSVKVKSILFTLENANQQNNLANFKSVRFTLTSDQQTNPIEIGNITFPDSTASSYTFTPTNAPELRPYLNGTQLTYNVYGQLRRYTTIPLRMSVSTTLRSK